jgi:hypothetical protein
MIFIGIVSLGIGQITLGIFALRKFRKVISYSTIAFTTIVIIFWFGAILTQPRPNLTDIVENVDLNVSGGELLTHFLVYITMI